MEVVVTPRARKKIKKLPKVPQIAIVEKLRKLQGPSITGIVKLVGYKNAFRVRVGNYRIVYRIIAGKIYVVLVGHRKEVYQLLERLRVFK